ncbi:MAG: MFS transporter [Hyphomonadaceae bacterium]
MSTAQVLAVATCVLLNAVDGFDVLSISFAAPGIAAEWGIDRAALGVVLSLELIGMGVGSILLGRAADAIGRRPTIFICLALMTAGMCAAALSGGIALLAAARLVTGVGIGGVVASINAIVAEHSNSKNRTLAVTMMAAGYPIGAVLGGAIASTLLTEMSWRAIFVLGTAATTALVPLVWMLLPESIEYLLRKRPRGALERVNRVLLRMQRAPLKALPPAPPQSPREGVAQLFSAPLLGRTMLLTCAYFMLMMPFYFLLKWIPKIVVDMGYAPGAAAGVLVSANVGGAVGSILLGLLSHKFEVRTLVVSTLFLAAVSLFSFGWVQSGIATLSLAAMITGFFSTAALVGIYAMVASAFPTEARASGTGLVIGVGRAGAAAGPVAAGVLFAMGHGLPIVALVMALGSVVAALLLIRLPRDAGCASHA